TRVRWAQTFTHLMKLSAGDTGIDSKTTTELFVIETTAPQRAGPGQCHEPPPGGARPRTCSGLGREPDPGARPPKMAPIGPHDHHDPGSYCAPTRDCPGDDTSLAGHPSFR